MMNCAVASWVQFSNALSNSFGKSQKQVVLVLATWCMMLSNIGSLTTASSTAGSGDMKLLVVLLDGFRWDYLDTLFQPNELEGFRKLQANGVQANSLQPAFPSLSYVNYYSGMTGLHAESHGMIDNYMYDPIHKKKFIIGENKDQYEPFWWDDGEPLWVTAAIQGKRSYMWYWPGCEVSIRGKRPTFCDPYQENENPSFEKLHSAFDGAVQVLSNGSADIAAVYLEQVDDCGHKLGPKSDNLTAVIRRLDIELLRVQNLLESTKFINSEVRLVDRVNLIIFSDHGMTAITDSVSGKIYVNESILPSNSDVMIGSKFGPIIQIYTDKEHEDQVYDVLKNLHPNVTVYRKAEIPDRYYLKNHYRTAPLVLFADKGYVLHYQFNVTTTNLGFHGYDNELLDMHGIFFASGPDFKKSFRLKTIPIVDLYQVMCHVLKIDPSPHNGTWSHISEILVDAGKSDSKDHLSLSTSLLLLQLLMSALILVTL